MVKKNVELWKVAFSPKQALEILKTRRIPMSHRSQEPKNAVFAYLQETVDFVKHFGDPSNIWVVFTVPEDEVFIGDLRLEDTPQYSDSFMPYTQYRERQKRYLEPEALVLHEITVDEVKVYDRQTLNQLTIGDIEKRAEKDMVGIKDEDNISCEATLEAAAELIAERCSIGGKQYPPGIKLSEKEERKLKRGDIIALRELGVDMVGYEIGTTIIHPIHSDKKDEISSFLKERGITFSLVPHSLVLRAWNAGGIDISIEDERMVLKKGKREQQPKEHILLVSTKGESCEACTVVTDYIKNAIAKDIVRVIEITDEAATEIIKEVFGKADYEYPAYVIKEGEEYKKGDLRDLLVQFGED